MTTTIENEAAVQRDTVNSFFVDVTFELIETVGGAVTLAFDWRRGTTDPWVTANPQPVDFRHTATTPQSGLPTSSPGESLHFTWNAFFDLPEGSFTDVFLRITAVGTSTEVVAIGPLTVVTAIATQASALAQAQARRNIISKIPGDFLGNGITTPIRRGSSDLVSASGVDLIRAAVGQILGTKAAVGDLVGEVPWRPDFGSKLWVLKHRSNDPTLEGQAEAFVKEALLWEPRVEVTEVLVETEPAAGPNELRIRVRYRVLNENSDDNRVLLPVFEELVSPAA